MDQIEVVDDWLAYDMEADNAQDSGDEDLPTDPIEVAEITQLLGGKLNLETESELERRRFMKASKDYRARVSRFIPEYVEAFGCAQASIASTHARTAAAHTHTHTHTHTPSDSTGIHPSRSTLRMDASAGNRNISLKPRTQGRGTVDRRSIAT